MGKPILLEICVPSLEHAIAAEQGGADRIELCEDLACGGITPREALMREVRRALKIPVQVLIRPRGGDFEYSPAEFAAMERQIDVAKEIGLDGVVVGVLDDACRVDIHRTAALVARAHPLPLTFHRAFDECPDLPLALGDVVTTGAVRILTSGGKASAAEGIEQLAELVAAAAGRISIMPGGGVRLENLEAILGRTGAQEIHTSLDGSLISPALFEGRVRELIRALANVSRAQL